MDVRSQSESLRGCYMLSYVTALYDHKTVMVAKDYPVSCPLCVCVCVLTWLHCSVSVWPPLRGAGIRLPFSREDSKRSTYKVRRPKLTQPAIHVEDADAAQQRAALRKSQTDDEKLSLQATHKLSRGKMGSKGQLVSMLVCFITQPHRLSTMIGLICVRECCVLYFNRDYICMYQLRWYLCIRRV